MLTDRPLPGHITGLYVFTLSNLMALLHVSMVVADVRLNSPLNETLEVFYDLPAQFGPRLTTEGITGYLVTAKPLNACVPIQPPPLNKSYQIKWIAVIERGGCDFATKVLNAQNASYAAVIVFNDRSEKLVSMPARKIGGKVTIPSVFVGESDGLYLAAEYSVRKGPYVQIMEPMFKEFQTALRSKLYQYVWISMVFVMVFLLYSVTLDGKTPFDYNLYLIPFAIVVGCCFVLMVIFMIGKLCRDMRKRRKSRLSKSNLKKIPVKKYKKGDKYDVCAICLDDYEEGEKLRVLPCAHAYHLKCIDPWLTKNKRTCPVCKRKVFPGQPEDSDSDSEEEETPTHTERTPLLGNRQTNTNPLRRSTFDNSGLPELVRPELGETSQYRDTESSSESDGLSVEQVEGAVGGTEALISIEDIPAETNVVSSRAGSINSVSENDDDQDNDDVLVSLHQEDESRRTNLIV